MMRTPVVVTSLVTLLAAGCGYEAPLRKNRPDLLNAISGGFVASGMEEPAPGVVVVYAANNVGPPDGTGNPVTLSAVRPESFSGDPANGFAAPYTVTQLPDGDYVLDGLLDMDGDFSPSLTAMGLAGATCGDFGGIHIGDYETGERGVVRVEGGNLTHDIPIIVDDEFTTERPAFTFAAGPPTIVKANGLDPFSPLEYTLVSTGIHARYDPGQFPNTREYPDGYQLHLDGPCPADADPVYCAPQADPCLTAFAVTYIDVRDNDTGELVAGGDGKIDLHPDYDPVEGLLDVWPRVYLQYLGVPELDSEGRVARDDDGNLLVTPPDLPEGEGFASESFPFARDNRFGFGPVAIARTEGRFNEPIFTRELPLAWAPAMVHLYPEWNDLCDGEAPEDLTAPCQQTIDLRVEGTPIDAVPAGVWSVTVINQDGQIWTLPNELALPAQEALDGMDPMLQGEYLIVE